MRTFTRVISAVLAVALLAGGVLGVIEVLLAASGRQPWLVPGDRWDRNLRTTPWRDNAAVVAAIILLAVGLLLLLSQLLRRRPASYEVTVPPEARARAEVSRRGIERAAGQAASQIDGVDKVHARAGAKSLRIDARTSRTSDDTLETAVSDAVGNALMPLQLRNPPPLDVRVRPTR